jgi:hypothetical protein
MDYHAARPWEALDDDAVFGVEDPATGTIGWCSVLGGAGEMFGLAVYDGPQGLALYRAILREEASIEEVQTTQPGFLVAFGPRNALEPDEHAILRALGIRPRGRDAWPIVRALVPGYLPDVPDAAGARRLMTIMAQVLAVAASMPEAPEALAPDAEARLIVRRREGPADAWASVRVTPDEPPPVRVPEFPDALRLRRLARFPQRVGTTWECDYAYAPIPIEDTAGKPGYAAVVLVMDRASGLIVQGTLGSPPLDHAFLQEAFVAAMETARARPCTVYVRSEPNRAALAPLAAAAGFSLSATARLPMLEQARASMVASMMR